MIVMTFVSTLSNEVGNIHSIFLLRAACKFGRRVQFVLQRKMLKPPIARLPAIETGLKNHRS